MIQLRESNRGLGEGDQEGLRSPLDSIQHSPSEGWDFNSTLRTNASQSTYASSSFLYANRSSLYASSSYLSKGGNNGHELSTSLNSGPQGLLSQSRNASLYGGVSNSVALSGGSPNNQYPPQHPLNNVNSNYQGGSLRVSSSGGPLSSPPLPLRPQSMPLSSARAHNHEGSQSPGIALGENTSNVG